MAIGPQNQNISLTMVLEAQDKASAQIKAVGDELQKLGRGVNMTALSAGVQASMTQVNAAIRAGAQERDMLERQNARKERDQIQQDLRQRSQDIRQALAGDTAEARRNYETRIADAKRAARLLEEAWERAGTPGTVNLAPLTARLKNELAQQETTLRAAAQKDLEIEKRKAADLVRENAKGWDKYRADSQAALTAEIAAQRAAGERMVLAAKTTAAEMARASKETMGFAKSVDGLHGSVMGALGPLEKMVTFAKMMVVWQIGYTAISAVMEGIGQVATGTIATNVQFEKLAMTFSAVYQTSTAMGQSMIAWLDAFATKVPGTREEVREAALAFAAAGDNVKEIMPTVSNLAAIMGVDLPKAAQAMIDAQQGRFEMLQVSLKTTKESLQAFGLEVDRVGHVTRGTFVPAIERYVAMRFGEHVEFGNTQLAAFHRHLQVTGTQAGIYAKEIQNVAMVQAGTIVGASGAQQQQFLPQTMAAIAQAQQGNMATLHQMYGVTVQDLDKIDRGWRATGESAQIAFAKWAAATHGGQQALLAVHPQESAIALQMKTLSGAFSNVMDSFAHLQQVLGKSTFDVLKAQVKGLYDLLQSPAMEIFVHQVGTKLGDALQHVVTGIKEWYHTMGGLPGILRVVQTAAQDVWAVLEGLGQGFKNVLAVLSFVIAPLQVALSLFGLIGDRSKDGAGALRIMAEAAIDLYAALKAFSILQAIMTAWAAMAGVLQKAAVASRELAAAQALVAASAGAEAVAEGAAATGVSAATAASGAGALKAGWAKGATAVGALLSGETVAAGLTGLGAAAMAAAPPLLMVALAAAAVIGAFKLLQAYAETQRNARVAQRLEPFIPPHEIKGTPASGAWNALVNTNPAAGIAALLGFNPSFGARESTTDSYSTFARSLPKNARTLYENQVSGTGQALAEHERAWLEYLSEHPKVLKQLDQTLKAAHKPQLTMQHVNQMLQDITQGQRGFTKEDVAQAVDARKAVIARLNADIKYKPNDIAGQAAMLQEATYQVAITQGKSIDTAVKESTDAEKNWVKAHWKQFSKTVQDELTQAGVAPGKPPGSAVLYTEEAFRRDIGEKQQGLQSAIEQNMPWPIISKAFGDMRAVAQRGVSATITGSYDYWKALHDGIALIAQHLGKTLQWDESLGMPATVLRKDIATSVRHLRQIHAATADIAQATLPAEMQLDAQAIPDLVLAAPRQVKKFFMDLKKRLASEGADGAQQAAIYAKVYKDYTDAKAQQAEQVLQADIVLNRPQQAFSLMNAHVQQMRQQKAPQPLIDAYLKQTTDAIFQPAVQVAQSTLQYDEMIKAPWATIVADINAYAAALDKTSMSAKDKAMAVHQAWESALSTHQQNLDLQLQYDQMMQAPYATIVADIQGIGQDMTDAGKDFREVAIKTHGLMVAAAQHEEQTQQGLLQYAETMNEPLSQIMSHVNARAGAEAGTDASPWQRILDRGHDIQGAVDAVLSSAMALHRPLSVLVGTINEGAQALLKAGWTKAAVAQWRDAELERTREPFRQFSETYAANQFTLAVQNGTLTMGNWNKYLNTMVAPVLARPLQYGETRPEHAVALQVARNEKATQILGSLYDTATKQLQWDRDEGGDRRNVPRDVARAVAIYAREPGVTAEDARRRKWELEHQGGGQMPPVAQPYHAYGGLAASAGYGSVTASFGVPSTATSILLAQLAESRRQTHYWQQQDAHDKQVIASLQAQLVVGKENVSVLRDIRGSIISSAPTPQRSVHSHLRNAGVPSPIYRP